MGPRITSAGARSGGRCCRGVAEQKQNLHSGVTGNLGGSAGPSRSSAIDEAEGLVLLRNPTVLFGNPAPQVRLEWRGE